MVKFRVPFTPSPSNSDPERDMLEFARKTTKEFEKEQYKIYETLIRDDFLIEADISNDYSRNVSWKSNVTNENMFEQNAL
ncbi:hypothetical protein RYX36_025041, partial [Vicia faba]